MDIQEIIKRNHLDQKEMEYVVTQYIKELKGVDVSINVEKVALAWPKWVRTKLIEQQLSKLNDAYQIAAEWFSNK